MQNGTSILMALRVQRTDLHVAKIRQELESRYGQLFSDAVALGDRLESAALPQAEYDAAVVGLVGSTIFTVRPMPSNLRAAIGGLLGLVEEDRSKCIRTIAPGGRETELPLDRVRLGSVITALGICLYPAGTYLPGVTDRACELDAWATPILAEVDAGGVLSPEAVGRLRNRLASQQADAGSSALSSDRRSELVTLVENAYSMESALICIASHVREQRLASVGRVPGARASSDTSEGFIQWR